MVDMLLVAHYAIYDMIGRLLMDCTPREPWYLIEEKAKSRRSYIEYDREQPLLEVVNQLVYAFKPLQQEVKETKEVVFE